MPKKVTKGVRDDWQTPDWLMEILKKDYDFIGDLAASEVNTKFKVFFSEENNFLQCEEFEDGIYWMNPPFSKAKAFYQHALKHNLKMVSIYKNDNPETQVWQDLIFPNFSFCFMPKGRINYADEKGVIQPQAMFPSAIFGFNVKKPEELVKLRKGFLMFR